MTVLIFVGLVLLVGVCVVALAMVRSDIDPRIWNDPTYNGRDLPPLPRRRRDR